MAGSLQQEVCMKISSLLVIVSGGKSSRLLELYTCTYKTEHSQRLVKEAVVHFVFPTVKSSTVIDDSVELKWFIPSIHSNIPVNCPHSVPQTNHIPGSFTVDSVAQVQHFGTDDIK